MHTYLSTHLWAWYDSNVSATYQLQVGAVLPGCYVHLGTETWRLRQTPFTTRGPAAVVHDASIHSLAHDRSSFEATVEFSVGRDVNGDGQINERNTAEDHHQLTKADASDDPFVLSWNNPGLTLVATGHDVYTARQRHQVTSTQSDPSRLYMSTRPPRASRRHLLGVCATPCLQFGPNHPLSA